MDGKRTASAAAAGRRKAFMALLDPANLMPGQTLADTYSLRQLCMQGSIPESPDWVRSQAWKVLLEYLPAEKRDWPSVLTKRRNEYYQFVQDFLPLAIKQAPASDAAAGVPGNLSERDVLLDQLYKDLSRSRKNGFAFYQSQVWPSKTCPLAPLPEAADGATERLACRHDLLKRLEQINHAFAIDASQRRAERREAEKSQGSNLHNSGLLAPPEVGMQRSESSMSGRSSPASFTSAAEGEPSVDDLAATANDLQQPEHQYDDVRWHSLLRILYVYALLNPSIGYIQGMNEIVFVFLYAFGSGRDVMAGPAESASAEEVEWTTHAEADTFWCFSALVGEFRELFDFDGVDHAAAGLRVSNVRGKDPAGNLADMGMAGALKKFSLRLRWLDEELWKVLRSASLDPRLPYYSFRWLACLLSTELTLPSILRVWDVLLAEHSTPAAAAKVDAPTKVDLLIDICCALLVRIRNDIIEAATIYDTDADADGTEGPFARCMLLLQSLPDSDIEPVLEMAHLYRQRRLASALTGDAPPLEDDTPSTSDIRERATNMYQNLRKSASPQFAAGRSWLRSFSPQGSPAAQPSDEPPQRRTSGSILNRYAEALQSSDAAANFSKISTNLTAKAMTSFGRAAEGASTPTQPRLPSFSLAGQGLMSRARDAAASLGRSSSNPTAEGERTPPPLHPAVGSFSQADMPQFPLPSLNDPPPRRQEYSHDTQTLRDMFLPSSPGSSDQSTGSALLPSMRAALGGAHSRESSRMNGQKPLLLAGAARSPREMLPQSPGSTPDSSMITSRKVSTGPLASHSNSPAQAGPRRGLKRGTQGSVSTASSETGSVVDPTESSHVSSASSSSRAQLPVKEYTPAHAYAPASTPPATAPAAAFSKARQARGSDVRVNLERLAHDEERRRNGLPMEDSSLRSDPLEHEPVTARIEAGSGLQRSNVMRTSSASSSAQSVLDTPGSMPTALPDTVDELGELPERPLVDGKRVSLFEQPRSAPQPPAPVRSNTAEDDALPSSATIRDGMLPDTVERYKLSDAPVPAAGPDSPERPAGVRQDSVGRSAGGRLTRSRMASRRTNSSSSTRSGGSIARMSSASQSAAAAPDVSTITEGSVAGGGSSENIADADADANDAAYYYGQWQPSATTGMERDDTATLLAPRPPFAQPGAGTGSAASSDPPSPGIDAGTMLSAAELLRSLELQDEQSAGAGAGVGAGAHAIKHDAQGSTAEAHASIGSLFAGDGRLAAAIAGTERGEDEH